MVEFWIWLWKIVLIGSVALFAALAVTVTIGGAFDIRRLFRTLREQHAQSVAADADESDSN